MNRRRPGNSKYVKKMNRMAILSLIKEEEPISRRQLAGITGLTPPAVTGIVRELLDMGFVTETGLGPSEGGRKPVSLSFNAEAGYVLGVEVTRNNTLIGLADLKNRPNSIRQVSIDMTDPSVGLPLLIHALREIMAEPAQQGRRFYGAGIAFPGLLTASEGKVRRSVNLGQGWDGFPLKESMEAGLGLPVVIENNSNASALAERWFGGGVDSQDLVYVNMGEGISAGIILGDRILQGFQGHAGEIGHIVMVENGSLCNCGNRGCLEALCGTPALVKKANSEMTSTLADDPLYQIWKSKGSVNLDDILAAAVVENSYAWNLMQIIGRYVGLAIADTINLYNPQVVFVGGRLISVAPTFLRTLQETVLSHAFPEIARSTQIKVSKLGIHSGVIGACALALRELFQSLRSTILEDAE